MSIHLSADTKNRILEGKLADDRLNFDNIIIGAVNGNLRIEFRKDKTPICWQDLPAPNFQAGEVLNIPVEGSFVVTLT